MTTIFKDFLVNRAQRLSYNEIIRYKTTENNELLIQPNNQELDIYFLDWIEARYQLKIEKQIPFGYLGCFKVTKEKIYYLQQETLLKDKPYLNSHSIDFEKSLDLLVLPVLNINIEDINNSKILKILIES